VKNKQQGEEQAITMQDETNISNARQAMSSIKASEK
jgi:hypothetical protein